jgi:hypothetical protein
MAAYTVHIPSSALGAAPAPGKIIFLRDGFSWGAFLFGPLWLAWRRAWLAAFLWVIALAVLAFAAAKLGLAFKVAIIVGFALALGLGFEGPRLIAWTLSRKGYSEGDIVVGDNLDEAEEVFFSRWRPAPPSSETAAADRRDEAPEE